MGTARTFTQDQKSDRTGLKEDATGIAAGAQWVLGQDLWGGIGAAYERTDGHNDIGGRGAGDWGYVGGILKTRMGNWTALGSLDGGLANVTSRRSIALPGLGATALGEQHVTFGSVRGQVAYTQPMGIIYVKPMLDVAATYTNLDGYHERGAGALDLIVAGADTWIYSATPAVEVGAQYRTVGGGLIRPYLRAGVSFLSDPTTVTSAAFEGAPGTNPMQINGKADKTYAEVGAGLVMFPRSGVSMKLNYDGRFSESTESHSGSAKVGINF